MPSLVRASLVVLLFQMLPLWAQGGHRVIFCFNGLGFCVCLATSAELGPACPTEDVRKQEKRVLVHCMSGASR